MRKENWMQKEKQTRRSHSRVLTINCIVKGQAMFCFRNTCTLGVWSTRPVVHVHERRDEYSKSNPSVSI